MSDESQGPGWWQASDLKWYPPELHSDDEALPPPPPDRPPAQIGTPSAPTWDRKPLAIAAGAVIVVIVAATAGYVLTGPKSQPSTSSRPFTMSQPSTSISQPPSPTVAPVAEAALDGLLLNPDQINTAMDATGMTVTQPWNTLNDVGFKNPTTPQECTPIDGAAEAAAYTGSGWTAERGQSLQDPSPILHAVDQGVILFPSAQAAAAFVSASAQNWPACANRTYTGNVNNLQWSAGPVSTADGTVSATTTEQDANTNGWACQRALTARNNVVIDVAACSHNATDQGINIAHQIAAKVPR
jgi:serine/threonine kinase PknH